MAVITRILALCIFTLYAAAQGTQFITGSCTSDADCASACCGFNSGTRAGPVVAQERDGGCGFGNAQPNDDAARRINGGGSSNLQAESVGSAQPDATAQAPPKSSTARMAGTQFITGSCSQDADCASACCGFRSGKCAGPAVAQERDGGCGFGDLQPNDNALKALQRRRVAW